MFRNLGTWKQRDGDLAGDDAIVLCICLLEQETKHALLIVGEVELRVMAWWARIIVSIFGNCLVELLLLFPLHDTLSRTYACVCHAVSAGCAAGSMQLTAGSGFS
jgi:hypothetical protein